MFQHIAIAGNIGAGKTTLTRLLAEHFGWEPHYEDVAHNPYLDDFYNDMARWSFNLQVYFLNNRLKQLQTIWSGGQTVVRTEPFTKTLLFLHPICTGWV